MFRFFLTFIFFLVVLLHPLTSYGSHTSDPTVSLLQNRISKLLSKEKNYVIINFDKLSYLNSSGLGALITILTKSRNFGGDTIITDVPKIINELLLVSKLNTVFKIEPTFSEAVDSLNKLKNN